MKKIILFFCALLSFTAATAQQSFTDDFNGTILNTRWTVVNPNPNSSVTLTGSGSLQITASPTGGSDYFLSTNYNAPRIVTPLTGDWIIETQFTFNPTVYFQGAGFILLSDSDPNSTAGALPANREFYMGNNIIHSGAPDRLTTLTTMYFKLMKQGSVMTFLYGPDKDHLDTPIITSDATAYTYGGLISLRQIQDGEATVLSTPIFDYYKYTPLPSITSFTPASGAVGTSVTINGVNFDPTSSNNSVKFNGTTAVVTASTATSITTTVPSGATSGPITVTVGGNTATSANVFCVPYTPASTSGLIASFNFNGNFNDASGNNNNAINNGVTLITDRCGNPNSAIFLNGTSSSNVTIPTSSSMESILSTQEMTVSAWFNMAGTPPLVFPILERYNPNVDNGMLIEVNNFVGGTLMNTDYAGSSTTCSHTWATNEWHQISITYSKAKGIANFYADGILICSNPFNESITTDIARDFVIGTSWSGPDEFTYGAIDDFKFYNRALSDCEVLSLYSTTAITSFTPSSGQYGTSVTITGKNFDPTPANNVVKFNGTNAVVTASTTTSITATVPFGATTGPITISVNCAPVVSSTNFTVNYAAPFGNTITLNGTTDFVNINDQAALRPTDLTLENWINFSSSPTGQVFIGKALSTSTDNNSYAIYYLSGTLRGFVNNNATQNPEVIYSWVPVVGQWYHVAFTFNSTTKAQTLYINGAAVATNTAVASPEYSSTPVTIGGDLNFNVYNAFISGQMDEARIWNVARTQTQIQSTLNSTLVGNETGLVAYYKMDEFGAGAGITVKNSATATGATLNGTTFGTACTPIFTGAPTTTSFTPSSGAIGTTVVITGTNFGTTPSNNIVKFNGVVATVTASTPTSITTTVPFGVTGTGPISVTVGCNTATSSSNFTFSFAAPFGNTVTMNGTTDYVLVADNPALRPVNMTLEAWVNFGSTSGVQNIFNKVLGTGNNDTYQLFYNAGVLYATAMDVGGFNGFATYTFTPTVGQWYHIAFTYNDATKAIILYLNGALVGTHTAVNSPGYDAGSIYIGGDLDFGATLNFFNGKIDEARIWNTDRSQSAIQSTMNAPLTGGETNLVAYYKMDEVGAGAGITVKNSATATGTTLNALTFGTACTPIFTVIPPTITSFSPSAGFVGTTITITGTNFSSIPANNTVKFNGVAATVIASTATSITTTVPSGATAGSLSVTVCGSTATSSGNFTVTTLAFDPCRNNIQLNGTTDYVEVADDAALRPSAVTIEAWINLKSFPAGSAMGIVIKRTGQTTDDANWQVELYNQQNIRFSYFDGSIWQDVDTNTNPINTLNTWYHVAATYSAGTAKVYVNGILLQTVSSLPPLRTDYTGQLQLGRGFNGYLQLNLDEVRIWNVARSEAEIQTTIHSELSGSESGLVAYYKLNEAGKGQGINVTNSAATGTALNGSTFGSSATPVFTSPGQTITSFSPTIADIGNTVTITGTNFDPVPSNNIVKFNGTTSVVTASTSTSITTTVPSGATTGAISVTIGCTLNSSGTNFTVCTPPAAPAATGANRCGTGTVTLSASGGSNGQYRWYMDASTASPIAGEVNDTFITSSITASTTYYVAINTGNCEGARTAVVATINSIPTAPTITGASGCSSSAITLTASGGTNGQYRWYDVASGGSALTGEVNSTFVTPSLINSTTYYVAINNGTCESSRIPVTATIQACAANQPPDIKDMTVQAPIEGKISIALTDLLSDPDNNLDLSTLRIAVSPLSGAKASIDDQYNLILDYTGISFSGTDKITIEVCDLQNACAEKELSIDVIGDVIVYDGISPNGDQRNELFYLQFIDDFEETKKNHVYIYNRWGDLLFDVADYDNKTKVFIGLNNNGNEIPPGTYFYKVEFASGKKPLTGYLTLKR